MLSPIGVRRLAWALLGLSLLMLVMTLLVGPEIKGAQRWLPIGLMVLQPGEFAKPALVVATAALLARAQGIGNALPAILLGAVVALLLLAQPDVKMAIVVVALLGIQLFLAGLPWLLVIALIGLGAVGLWQTYRMFPHVADRIDGFIDPSSGDHYQVGLALKAIKSAAWFGSGPGEGTVKYALPDAHSDFVFAVVGGGVRPGGMPGAARAVRLRAAARPGPRPAGRRSLRAARRRGPAGPSRAADLHQSGRQREPAAGDRHDPAVHQLRRLLALRAGDRHGPVPGADPPARRHRGLRMSRPVVIAAGGTGGHMFPALALAAELEQRGQPVVLACDRRGARYLPAGMRPRLIRAASPSGDLAARLRGTAELALGFAQSLALLRRQRPLAVAAFGGYASVPVGLAAQALGIPTLIHEQNAVLGRANRLIARRARRLALTFATTRGAQAVPAPRRMVTGNPVRAEVAALRDRPYRLPAGGERLPAPGDRRQPGRARA